jgi:hypothetical protein
LLELHPDALPVCKGFVTPRRGILPMKIRSPIDTNHQAGGDQARYVRQLPCSSTAPTFLVVVLPVYTIGAIYSVTIRGHNASHGTAVRTT